MGKCIALVACLMSLTTGAVAFDVTRCGMTLLPREVGELTGDLACPSFPGSCDTARDAACASDFDCPPGGTCLTGGPRIGKRATLVLNGHTLTQTAAADGVLVSDSTGTIEGPGVISAPNGTAVRVMGHGKLTIADVEIRDSKAGIVTPFTAKVKAANLDMHDVAGHCIDNAKALTGRGVSLVRCGTDDQGIPPSLSASLARAAISAVSVKLDGLTASDNGGVAIGANTIRLVNGALGGNDAAFQGYDLVTFRRPRLASTTCAKSALLDSSLALIGTWGVCAGD